MKKIITCFFCLFVFSAFVLASENTFTFDLGDYKMSSLIITKTEHAKKLFRYEDPVKLKKYLDQKDSNLSAINASFLDTGKDKILFDAGTDADVLIERLQEINIKPKDINFICITHMHFDHIGGLVKNGKRYFLMPLFLLQRKNSKPIRIQYCLNFMETILKLSNKMKLL